MTTKAFVLPDKTTRVTCPKCARSKTQNVSSFLTLDREIRATIRCKCGHTFKIVLERRKHFRKSVDLFGTFWMKEKVLSRDLVVKDISKHGIKFQIKSKPPFQAGDRINVEFRLDNPQRTKISKIVTIRNIKAGYVGAEFTSVDATSADDIAIGFYLM